MKNAHKFRRLIGDLGFDYWVREWRDGEIWAGPTCGSHDAISKLRSRFEELGYNTEMNGKPGTSGEWVIDVKEKGLV